MKIGIVSVLYNSDSVIEEYVECLNNQTFRDFKVLYIENEFANSRCQVIVENHSNHDFEFLRNNKNVGIATGNNQGIDYFSERDEFDYIMFMNNDVVFEPTYLQQHADYQKRMGLETIVPKIYYHNSDKIWYAGGGLSYLKGGPRHWGHNKKDILVGRDYFKVDYAPTCSFLIKKDLIIKDNIRMWDQLFVYYDDYQFCRDLKRVGVAINYVPALTLYHKISVSTGGPESKFTRRYMTRNKYYLLRRHKSLMLCQMPAALLYNIIRGRKIETSAIIESMRMP